jgi:hypothetical protein
LCSLIICCGVTQLQRCVIEDLDLSGVNGMANARIDNVTFARVVFKGAALPVRALQILGSGRAVLLQRLQGAPCRLKCDV